MIAIGSNPIDNNNNPQHDNKRATLFTSSGVICRGSSEIESPAKNCSDVAKRENGIKLIQTASSPITTSVVRYCLFVAITTSSHRGDIGLVAC